MVEKKGFNYLLAVTTMLICASAGCGPALDNKDPRIREAAV